MDFQKEREEKSVDRSRGWISPNLAANFLRIFLEIGGSGR
jgi:hypothetical protein